MSQIWRLEITDILGVWWKDMLLNLLPKFLFNKVPSHYKRTAFSTNYYFSNDSLALQNITKTASQQLCRPRRLNVASRRLHLLQVHHWVYPYQLHRQLLRSQQEVSTEGGKSRQAHQQNGAVMHGGCLCPALQKEGQQDYSIPSKRKKETVSADAI